MQYAPPCSGCCGMRAGPRTAIGHLRNDSRVNFASGACHASRDYAKWRCFVIALVAFADDEDARGGSDDVVGEGFELVDLRTRVIWYVGPALPGRRLCHRQPAVRAEWKA